MRDLRTGVFIGVGALLAGIGPFILPGQELQRFAAAASFCLPAMAPLFFADRHTGTALTVLALGLVLAGSIGGVFVLDPPSLRRAMLVRNLQFASAGAVTAACVVAIGLVREASRRDTGAA